MDIKGGTFVITVRSFIKCVSFQHCSPHQASFFQNYSSQPIFSRIKSAAPGRASLAASGRSISMQNISADIENNNHSSGFSNRFSNGTNLGNANIYPFLHFCHQRTEWTFVQPGNNFSASSTTINRPGSGLGTHFINGFYTASLIFHEGEADFFSRHQRLEGSVQSTGFFTGGEVSYMPKMITEGFNVDFAFHSFPCPLVWEHDWHCFHFIDCCQEMEKGERGKRPGQRDQLPIHLPLHVWQCLPLEGLVLSTCFCPFNISPHSFDQINDVL